MSENPRLRYLEMLPFQDEKSGPMIVLRDPLQISDRMMAVSPQLLGLLALLNGRLSLPQIQEEFSRQEQERLSLATLQDIVGKLDEAFFLDNENFRNRQRRLQEEFRLQGTRPSYHAGKSYPGDAVQLQETLAGFYQDPAGAGLPGQRTRGRIQGLVAPHIDLRNGGPVYTHAYRALAESEPPDLFAILGTGHMGLPEMFSVSHKEFVTPLATSPVDVDFLKAFRESAGERFQEDLTHRHEHTIEFQVVFLQHLFGSRIPILPVLTSFSFEDLESPEQRRLFDAFADAFRGAAKKTGKNVCLIASADLAHIGPRYGDAFEPTQQTVDSVSEKDRQMLQPVERGEADAFFEFVREEGDQRRICGFSPLYSMLALLEGKPGQTLAHSFTFMDPTRSFVTFCSMVF